MSSVVGGVVSSENNLYHYHLPRPLLGTILSVAVCYQVLLGMMSLILEFHRVDLL